MNCNFSCLKINGISANSFTDKFGIKWLKFAENTGIFILSLEKKENTHYAIIYLRVCFTFDVMFHHVTYLSLYFIFCSSV